MHSSFFRIPSHRAGLQLCVSYQAPTGAADQVPVLFIHGSSFPSALAAGFRLDGRSWMDVMALNGFATYALDFLGYGLSDRYPQSPGPAGLAVDVQADVDSAVELVRRHSDCAKVTLVAHSWGGSVAALYAQNHPDKVASLVLFAALTPNAVRSMPDKIAHAFIEMTPAQRIESMDALRPPGQAPLLAPDVFRSWGAAWLASDPLAQAAVRFPSGPEQDVADLQAGHGYYDPAKIIVPVLLIRGEWDKWPSAADYAWLCGSLSAAPVRRSVVVPEGTHVLHLERNRAVLYKEVLNFLRAEIE